MDLALNDLQSLICHKTQKLTNQQPFLYIHMCVCVCVRGMTLSCIWCFGTCFRALWSVKNSFIDITAKSIWIQRGIIH